jgi:hypothetical protein
MKRSLLWIILLLLFFAAALGVMRTRAAASERVAVFGIVSFTASPEITVPGMPVELSWKTSGASGATLGWAPEATGGDFVQRTVGLPPIGTMTVYPEENTVYLLECEMLSGRPCGTARITVLVRPFLTMGKRTPAIPENRKERP